MQQYIHDFLDDVESAHSKGTYKVRRRDLRKYNAYLQERDLNVTEVQPKDGHRFLREQGRDHADATVESLYSTLKLLYDFLTGIWAVMEEDDHPLEDLKRTDYQGNGKSKHTEAELVYLTPDEIEQLCENTGPERALRDELIIRLMFQTGVRRGELAKIKLDDVDREKREIRIRADKTDSWRTVYYQPSLDFLLNQWIEAGFRDSMYPSEYLFPSDRSEHISDVRLNECIQKAADRAGIQEVLYEDASGSKRYRVTAHALRHGHGVEALKSGLDTKFIQEHMGHEKIETTEKYLRVIDEDVKQAYRRFGSRPDGAEA